MGERLQLVPRAVASSLDDLVPPGTTVVPFATAQNRSGSLFGEVRADGQRLVLKRIELDHDFLMRASGDIGCRAVTAYAAGLLDVAADAIDHAVVAAARGVGRNGWGGAFLMRDVSADLVAPGDDPFTEEQHLRFVDHHALLCARTWRWEDTIGLMSFGQRWQLWSPEALDAERRLGWPEEVPRIAAEGWERFTSRVPVRLAVAIEELRHDSTPLEVALRELPTCLLHGDWKAANLGTAADGRTVLIDWAQVGEGPACHELGWYLALNRRKLPVGHTRERVMEEFRAALERHGVATGGWWDRQLALCLLGTVLQFGWEKAFGDDDELGWWCDRAAEGIARL